jgi:DNA-binding NtrC family response regulator
MKDEDIPMLISFADKIASEQEMQWRNFLSDAVKLLQEYDWTGNIRELRNVVERLIILGGSEISENDVKLFASK